MREKKVERYKNVMTDFSKNKQEKIILYAIKYFKNNIFFSLI